MEELDEKFNLINGIVKENKQNLHSDLWGAITDMFEKDGIDYMNESGAMRLITSTDGCNVLFYNETPYCAWNEPTIEFGLSDSMNTTIRADIILKKF